MLLGVIDRGTRPTDMTLPGRPARRIGRKSDPARPTTTFGRAASATLGSRWARTRLLLPWAAWLVCMAVLCAALLFDYQAQLIGRYRFDFAKLLGALLSVAAVAVSPWLG